MIRRVFVIGALWVALISCSGEAGRAVALPEFASGLPGQTAACLLMKRPLAPSLLAALEGSLGSELIRETPQLFRLGSTTKVAWKTLAQSRNFAEAWQFASDESAAVLFLDLEQLVDSQLKTWGKKLGPMRPILDILFLEGFRFGLFNLEEKAGGLAVAGRLRTSATRAGLPGLLSTKAGGGFLGAVAADDRLALDGRLETAIVRQMIERAATENTFTEALAAGVLSTLPKIITAHWTGEISLRLAADGELRLALGIVDREGLEAKVTRLPFVREQSGDLLGLPGGFTARVTAAVVYIGRDAFAVPKAVRPEPGLWLRGYLDGAYTATIQRVGDDLQISARLPPWR